ncbi:PhzF family phenazine biosynthesis protein [Adhaeribacter pallidiroseus]|uniref:Trans-2,3-dihydro-3-hydroxyanthranilate isomerase n=1 Tax=Adhaeribacter pallidiroseus TaxID=2072847 RepID=A0A369QTU1_9BACT|nr:PhzF family phenazine biosynthesis protein [Adhaeribacter pallidiroseus]RDC66229.1 Trans-2,3-dihydro-3-hydroxyanthranilate isomerase [Adhaeribacter pallidiroseus]
MKQKIYQIDAFTDKVFSGNPAAVCPLNQWLEDDTMQNIALENNLADTAFYVKQGHQYQIRWFTPTMEVALCGHATLAAAFVLFYHEGHPEDIIHFYSPRSGALTVTKKGKLLTLNFPADTIEPAALSDEIINCFDLKPRLAFKGKTDYLLVFDKEAEINKLTPAYEVIAKLKARGVIVTAKGDQVDFVSRFFAPQSGINEDPVTGSAHTTLTPYWAKQLNKTQLSAIQLSERKGYLQCTYLNDRVEISGQGKLYLAGEIYLD